MAIGDSIIISSSSSSPPGVGEVTSINGPLCGKGEMSIISLDGTGDDDIGKGGVLR